jgi:hypothetical protein
VSAVRSVVRARCRALLTAGTLVSSSSATSAALKASTCAWVGSFTVRHQFIDADLVCSIIDWEMAMVEGMMTSAELLQIRDGEIVRGELIYDAEDLRRAMSQAPPPAG